MLAETRRRLLGSDRASGFRHPDELVKALGVSESTVRRDLEALDLAGSIKRTHGGAVCVGEVRAMPAFDDRAATAAAEKQAIGRATAALLEDGDTVLLDGGTTTLEVARALLGRPVQVVTNSLPIAQLLASSKATDLILIGGYVYPRTGVALGPLAIADDAGHPGPQGDPGGGGDRGRGDLQLELAAGRDRAADDGVRPGGDHRRRPHQVRPAGAGQALRARRGRHAGGRPGPRRRVPRRSSKRPACRSTWRPLDDRATDGGRPTGRRGPTARGPKHEHRSPRRATRSRAGPLDPPAAARRGPAATATAGRRLPAATSSPTSRRGTAT